MTDHAAAVEFDIPQHSGEVLCVPPAGDFLALARRNAEALDTSTLSLGGMPLRDLRRRARSDAFDAAAVYTRAIGVPAAAVPRDAPLVVTGHQPLLVHPGVWVKHLLADRLTRHGFAALSMPVDNDEAGEISAEVPRLNGALRLAREVLLTAEAEVPYEAVPPPPADRWQAFVARLAAHVRTLSLPASHRALDAFARQVPPRVSNVGAFVTGMRRQYEGPRRYIELPVSAVSAQPAFKQCALHIIRDAPRFADAYNRHLGAYRERQGIRTTAQPFPDLQRADDQVETPFWLLAGGRRRALHAQRRSRSWRLVAGGDTVVEVGDRDGPEALADLPLHPRALTLTAFTRLCLADLFIHGVGGGRYDRVTDAVIREFFGIEPPGYAVVTATLHLPLAGYDTMSERQTLQRRLLELQHNPDRALAQPSPDEQALIGEKWRLIAQLDGGRLTRRERREATQRIREINERLATALAAERAAVEARLAALEGADSVSAATHRGYPFCLFPVDEVDALVDKIVAG